MGTPWNVGSGKRERGGKKEKSFLQLIDDNY